MISWLWVNRGLSGSLLLAALVAAAAVYVMSLRAENMELATGLAAAEARAARAVAGAERIRSQAEALISSRDAAAAEHADALARIRRAADACLDHPLPIELLDKLRAPPAGALRLSEPAAGVETGLPAPDSMKNGMGIGMWWWRMMAVLALMLTGCSESLKDETPLPELEITCPNPDSRARLGEGATYRDLAASRAEAVSGWRQCHVALAIAQE